MQMMSKCSKKTDIYVEHELYYRILKKGCTVFELCLVEKLVLKGKY